MPPLSFPAISCRFSMSRRATLLARTAISEISLLLSAKTISKEILPTLSMPNPPSCMSSLHNIVEQTEYHGDIRLKIASLDWPLPASEKKASSNIVKLIDTESDEFFSLLALEDHLLSPVGQAKNRIDKASKSEVEEALQPSLARVLTLSIESKRAASAGLECNAVHAVLRETKDVQPRNVLGERIPLAVAIGIPSNNQKD